MFCFADFLQKIFWKFCSEIVSSKNLQKIWFSFLQKIFITFLPKPFWDLWKIFWLLFSFLVLKKILVNSPNGRRFFWKSLYKIFLKASLKSNEETLFERIQIDFDRRSISMLWIVRRFLEELRKILVWALMRFGSWVKIEKIYSKSVGGF